MNGGNVFNTPMQRLWRYTFAKKLDEWNKLYTNKMKWENNTAYFETDQMSKASCILYKKIIKSVSFCKLFMVLRQCKLSIKVINSSDCLSILTFIFWSKLVALLLMASVRSSCPWYLACWVMEFNYKCLFNTGWQQYKWPFQVLFRCPLNKGFI